MLLFEEWLIPVCAAGDSEGRPWSLARLRAAEQLHPTPDRRDWRRWLQATGLIEQVPLKSGQLFDMLELGIVAAARGYGVSIGDLLMVAEDVNAGRQGALADRGIQWRQLLYGVAAWTSCADTSAAFA